MQANVVKFQHRYQTRHRILPDTFPFLRLLRLGDSQKKRPVYGPIFGGVRIELSHCSTDVCEKFYVAFGSFVAI
jgi:hypothetical protein